jgi:cytoskeletal protein CcmA (bactofilin family)|tara:strand:- start:1998 stop:3224 length:1227 start_codon:yes stop_codon:yes gene_type:complete
MTRARDLADYISTGVSDTELDVLDGVTAGTITASKAVVADSNKDVSSFRNVTLTGELDAATLDISGDADIDGTLEADGLSINGTAVTSTAAELNILDGVTATAAELNILDGVTSTAAELNILDGVTATATELNILDGVTSTTAELNILDGVTATTAELNHVDGVTSAIQTQIDTKAAIAGPTFTGTLAAPTINASTALQIGGVAITSTAAELNILDGVTSTAAELNILDGVTSTAAELNILDGVTSTAAELNILDGVTATAAELNYVDIATLGTSAASKAVSADANGNIKLSEEVQAKVYLETVVALSAGSSVTLDLATGNFFTLTTNQNTTFVFNYGNIQLTTNDVHGFVLKVTAGGTHSLTWPNTVDWPGGSAPDAPASGETDVFAFISHDGGSNWYGFRAGDAVG